MFCLGRLCLAYFAHKEPPRLLRYVVSNLVDPMARGRSLDWLQELEGERDAATVEKLEFIRDQMPQARLTASRWDVLEIALGRVSLDGLYAEFGVADGQSLRFICRHVNRTVYGFDSFRGLPEVPGSRAFGPVSSRVQTENRPKSRRMRWSYRAISDQTLPEFVKRLDARPAAFLHLDADLYSSTSTVLSALRDRIVPGTILVYNDYFGCPPVGKREASLLAFAEFLRASGHPFEYVACNAAGQQVAARILPKPDGSVRSN